MLPRFPWLEPLPLRPSLPTRNASPLAGVLTLVHHTAPHIPFKPADQWSAARAQLSGTVHCVYPRM